MGRFSATGRINRLLTSSLKADKTGRVWRIDNSEYGNEDLGSP